MGILATAKAGETVRASWLAGAGALLFLQFGAPAVVNADLDPAIKESIHLEIEGESVELVQWEREYLIHAVDRLYKHCKPDDYDELNEEVVHPREKRNQLSITTADGHERLIEALGGSSQPFSKLAIYAIDERGARRLHDCKPAHLLPVAGILESQSLDPLPSQRRTVAGLTSYEPNRLGWTFDDNDVDEGYLDAVFSLKYPLFHDGYYSQDGPPLNAYLAFTGRFSQYIESRDSSPVVGKRFNPKFFLRHWLGDDSRYVDVGLAHESNGQNINSEEAYLRERADFESEGQDPDFARDYISRGWDYLSLDWKHAWGDYPAGLNTYLNLKYFLDDGPFQGDPEEYNDWEGDGVNRRKEYDGLTLLAKYRFDRSYCLTELVPAKSEEWTPNFCLGKFAWAHTTGYDGIFNNNTDRLEFTVDLWGVPIMIWGQKGYNSDLVDYYKKVRSWGIALELQSNFGEG